MPETPRIPGTPSRRGVVAAAGGAGLAAVLTACGSSGDGSGPARDRTSGTPADGSADASGTATATASGSAPSASGGGTPLARTSEIPVGGGRVFADQKVVVTQPTAGRFEGFSAVCTHQGCTVSSVVGGTIECPCHGSRFRITDGGVAGGPANAPLPPAPITVSGGEITLR